MKLGGEPLNQFIDFWGRTTEQHRQLLKRIYLEVVHWKPKFITLPKNKIGHLFIDTMNILFEQVAEKKSNEETALYASMLMPHLVLARTRTDREQSIGKTLERRLHAWLRCDFEALFTEAKALQQRAPTRTKKDEVNDFKQFDFQMTAGKISNALRSLDDSQKEQYCHYKKKSTTKQ